MRPESLVSYHTANGIWWFIIWYVISVSYSPLAKLAMRTRQVGNSTDSGGSDASALGRTCMRTHLCDQQLYCAPRLELIKFFAHTVTLEVVSKRAHSIWYPSALWQNKSTDRIRTCAHKTARLCTCIWMIHANMRAGVILQSFVVSTVIYSALTEVLRPAQD